jgi:hypothetical protein
MDGFGFRGSVFETDLELDLDEGVDPGGWDYPVYRPEPVAAWTPWHDITTTVRLLCDLTAGLAQAHRTAVHLDELARAARPGLDLADVLPLLAAARYLVEEVDRAAVPAPLRQEIEKATGELAALLGARFGAAGHATTPPGLNCDSLYRDGPALQAFVAVLVEPSDQNITALRERLRTIASPGAAPTAGGTTVVPLADLLHRRPGLIRELADEYVHGVPAEAVLSALGLPCDSGAVRSGLARAVLIGYADRLVASTMAGNGNLARFDKTVRGETGGSSQG